MIPRNVCHAVDQPLWLPCRCFVDTKPRRMDAESCMILNNLSEMVVRELEKDVYLSQQRQQAQQLEQLNMGLLRAMDSFKEAVMVVDTSGRDGWTVEHINSSVTSETGDEDLRSGSSPCAIFCSMHGACAACSASCLRLQHCRQLDS